MGEALRVALIVIGVIIVAGVYLWGRQRRVRLETERLFEEAVNGPVDPNDDWEIVPIRADRSPAPDADHLANLSGISGREAVAPVSEEVLDEVVPTLREQHRDEPPAEPASEAEPARSQPDFTATETPAESGEADGAATPQEEQVFALTVMAIEGEFAGAALSEVFDDLGLVHGEMNLFHWQDPVGGEPVFGIANVLEPGMFELESLPELATPGLVLFMRLPGPISGADAIDQFLATARRLARRLDGEVCDHARQPLAREADAEMRGRAAPFTGTAGCLEPVM